MTQRFTGQQFTGIEELRERAEAFQAQAQLFREKSVACSNLAAAISEFEARIGARLDFRVIEYGRRLTVPTVAKGDKIDGAAKTRPADGDLALEPDLRYPDATRLPDAPAIASGAGGSDSSGRPHDALTGIPAAGPLRAIYRHVTGLPAAFSRHEDYAIVHGLTCGMKIEAIAADLGLPSEMAKARWDALSEAPGVRAKNRVVTIAGQLDLLKVLRYRAERPSEENEA